MEAPLDSHWPLLLGAAGSAAIHALIPDHWVPFVLVGRKQGWSTAKTLTAAGLGAVSDSLLSVLLGVAAILAGESVLYRFEPYHARIEAAGGMILVGFGLAYAAWALWRSRRASPHFHLHFHGHSHEGHSPKDLDAALGKGSFFTLVLVAGMSPCFVSVPIFAGAIGLSGAFQAAVVTLYLAVTVGASLTVAWTALAIHRELKLPFLERHAETLSGLVLALTGAFLLMGLGDHAPMH